MTVRYPTTDELIYINVQITSSYLEQRTLVGKQKVRDLALLEGAVGRPQQTVFGADAFPALTAKAAALLESVARSHPFADGNKRTATLAALFFLHTNGLRVTWDGPDALDRIVAVAEGKLDGGALADWLPTAPGEPLPEPDVAQDAALIAALMTQHAWLLDELARR